MQSQQPSDQFDRIKIRKRIAKERRWVTWVLNMCASIEGQATHRLEELMRMEDQLLKEHNALEAAKKSAAGHVAVEGVA